MIISLAVHHDPPTKPTDELESETLVDMDRPSIVAVDLDFDAVEVSKEETTFAYEARRLRAETLAPLVALTDPDEQRSGRGARDVEQAAQSNQLAVRDQNYRELDAVGLRPRILVKEFLSHLERVSLAWDADESREFEVLAAIVRSLAHPP
jgi:hypothetical protein